MGRRAEESNGKAGRRRAPARVLYARCFATWEPDTLSERIALSAEVIHLGELLGEQELVLDGRRRAPADRRAAGARPYWLRDMTGSSDRDLLRRLAGFPSGGASCDARTATCWPSPEGGQHADP
jgi:hypothetical protein